MLSFVRKCTFSSIKVIPICHPQHDSVYSYIAYGKDKSNAFLVDPGQSGKTLQYLQNNPDLQISNILLTHHHILHSGNLPELLQDLKALHPNKNPQIFIGEHDALKFQAFPFLPFQLIKKETSFEFNEIYLTCIPSPCHTVGSLTLSLRLFQQKYFRSFPENYPYFLFNFFLAIKKRLFLVQYFYCL